MVAHKKSTTGGRAPGSRGPTLRNVAELAGVSLMSVSRALNGGTVSQEVGARVAQAAEQLGYVANGAAQRMRGGRTKTIGMLINMDFDPRTEIMAILDCLIREMERAGNQVLLSIARGGPTQLDELLRGFVARGVDGLFFWNAGPSEVLARYERAGIPVVAVAFRDERCAGLPLVSLDAGPTFDEVFRRVRALGHRRAIEFVGSGDPAMHELFGEVSGLQWRRFDLGFDRAHMLDFLNAWQAEPDAPTLVMADYPRAAQLLAVCEELGVRVPEDLSVISTVDAVGTPLLRTPLSSILSDYEMLGSAAAAAMLAAIDGEPIEDVLMPGGMGWIERASTGPARRSPAAAKRRTAAKRSPAS